MTIKLVNISKQLNSTVFVFNVSHDNGTNTLDQKLVLKRLNNKWTASMSFENFPDQHTPTGAVTKLAEWMFRLASEMEKSPGFETIDLKTIQIYSKN